MKRLCTSMNWRDNYFDSCTFLGRYKDLNFGRVEKDCKVETALKNCDFSRAKLHMLGFVHTEVETCLFPTWPHFTVLHPLRNREDFLAIPLPEGEKIRQKTIVSCDETISAETNDWSAIAKKNNITTDPEGIRALLAAKPYIRL